MLRRIQMQDFLCYPNAEAHFDRPVALITGEHGTGKTAVLDAIRFAITGLARGIEQKNQMAEVIRDGAEAATVELELGRVAISRTVKRSGGEKLAAVVDGVDVPGKLSQVQAVIYDALGLDRLRAPIVLDAWRFLDLSLTERKALLWRAVEATITPEAILERLEARGLGGDLAVLAEQVAVIGFDEARKAEVERRREAKRELEQLEPPPNFGTYILNGRSQALAELDLPDQERRLLERRQQLEDAIADQGADRGKIEGQLEQLGGMKTRLEGALRQLDGAPHAAPDQIAAAGVEAGELLQRVNAELAALHERAGDLVERGAGGGPVTIEHPGVCPAITGEFKCPATARKLEAHAEKLTAQQAAAHDAFAKLEPELAAKEAEQAEAERKAESLRAAHAEALEWARKRDAVVQELEQTNESITALGDSLATASADGDSPSVEDLRSRVETGTNLVEALRNYKAQAARAERDAERGAQLAAARDRHDALERAFAPDGIPAELTTAALGPIRERLAHTGRLVGDVTLTPDFALAVRRNGQHRTERQLSRSERLRLGIAIQDALASIARDWPLLIVDELDVFNPRARPRVIGLLASLAGHPYGSVVALATLQMEAPAASPNPQVAVYWTRDGAIERVPDREAAA